MHEKHNRREKEQKRWREERCLKKFRSKFISWEFFFGIKSFQRHHLIIYYVEIFGKEKKIRYFFPYQQYTRYIITNDTLLLSLNVLPSVIFPYILLNQFEFNLELSALKEQCSLEFPGIFCVCVCVCSFSLNGLDCP